MLTPNEIRNNNLKRGAMGGYRAEEVEQFLEQIAAAVESLNARNAESIAKIGVLADKIEEYRKVESSINNALLSAQKLGDQTIRESQEKADEMIAESEKKATDIINVANFKAETTISEAEANAAELTQNTKEKMDKLVAETESYVQNLLRETTEKCEYDISVANARSEAIMSSVEESVQKQKALFDYYKNEIAAFRTNMIDAFRKNIANIEKLPSEINLDPRDLSDLVMAQPVAAFAAPAYTPEESEHEEPSEDGEAVIEEAAAEEDFIVEIPPETEAEAAEEVVSEAADGSLTESNEGEVTFDGVIDENAIINDEDEDANGFKITVEEDEEEPDERQGVLTFGSEEESASGFTFGN